MVRRVSVLNFYDGQKILATNLEVSSLLLETVFAFRPRETVIIKQSSFVLRSNNLLLILKRDHPRDMLLQFALKTRQKYLFNLA